MLNFLAEFAVRTIAVFGTMFVLFTIITGTIAAIFFRSRKKRLGKDDAWDGLLLHSTPSLTSSIIVTAVWVFVAATYLQDTTWIGAYFLGVFLGLVAHDHALYAFLRWRFKRYEAKKVSASTEEEEEA